MAVPGDPEFGTSLDQGDSSDAMRLRVGFHLFDDGITQNDQPIESALRGASWVSINSLGSKQ